MANKIKFFVGFLALIALFSVYSFFNSFSSSSPVTKTANILKNSMSFKVDPDTDKDGLTNRDESYWNTDFQNPDTDGDGFLDGEEVSSGHDPLIPAPNDLIDNKNLTAKFSNLTLSGLYEGSLVPGGPAYDKSLDDMVLAVMNDATSNFNSKIDAQKLKTVNSTQKNQEIYLKEMSVIFQDLILSYFSEMNSFQNNLDKIGELGFGNKDMVKYFELKSEKFQKILDQGLRMNVPLNWKTLHLGFLRIAEELTESNHSVSLGSSDPVKATAALNKIAGILDVLPSLTEKYANKIKSEEVNVQSTIFER